MSGKVVVSRSGEIAVLTIDNPPVNALSSAVRTALMAAIEDAIANDSLRAIVLAGAGPNFSAGADIREFERPARPPHLVDVVQRIEDAAKPVIAALHGNVLGGGCELALGCHYRVAAPGTRAGHPEVNLGLMPGDGGTQRLPRLIGFDAALALMLDGNPRAVEASEMTGFVDEIAGGDLLASAIAFARNIVAADASPRRTRSLPLIAVGPEVFARHAQSARKRRGEPAPTKIVAAVQRATEMPFPEAVARARADLLALRESPESRAMRHAFFAEREAAKLPPGVAIGTASDVSRAAVVGAGLMGQGIAISLLDAGLAVTLVETTEPALGRARDRIAAHYRGAAEKGRIAAGEAEARLSRLGGACAIEAIADAGCVIEAVFEDLEVKRGVFESIDQAAKPGALLATNTSYLDVAQIGRFTRRPQDVIGLHFFSPANIMRLVEVVRTDLSSARALATGLALVRRMRKVGVVCKGKDGFIGNRMLAQRTRECLFMLEEGALPQQIDAALVDFGFALGPLAVSDLAGLDIGWSNAILRRQLRELGGRDCDLLDRMVAAKRLGQKTGVGWFRYEPGQRTPLPDPVVEAMLVEHSRARGIARRTIAPAEIVERCLLAMVNEAARLLDEGVVTRASDVDVVWLTGYGFPRRHGGPLYYAEQLGLAQVLSRIETLAQRLGAAYWTPAPMLRRLAATGQGFGSLPPRRDGA